MSRPVVEPIAAEHVPEVAEFLHANLSAAQSVAEWQAALKTHWRGERPNFGFMLRDEGRIVGTICALYAERIIAGQKRSICNITSWCVLDSHRKLSMKLAMAVVQQGGHDFTDFSPTSVVGGVLRFLKFKPLPEAQAVVFCVPGIDGSKVLTRPADIESALTGEALQAYRDHERFPWLRHAVIGKTDAWCHVIYKPTTFKGLRAAKVLHMGDRAVFRRHLGRWCAHLLAQGIVTCHVESRRLPSPPWHTVMRHGFNAKVFLSDVLQEDDIDYLYSETMALDIT